MPRSDTRIAGRPPIDTDRDAAASHVFREDRRAVWRVIWTLALAFTGVARMMQHEGVFPWFST